MPPLSPPPVPLIPAPEGFTTVATMDQLRAAINATVWLGTLALYLPPGSVLLLGGSPILVDGINLQLSSEGEGALLNAEHRSRLFKVLRGGQLTLNFLTLANGTSENYFLMGGGALYIGLGSSVVVTDSLIIHSNSPNTGGAAAVSGGSLLLSNSSLVHSSCYESGGALHCELGGSVILTNASSIYDSVAHNGGGAAYITLGSSLLLDAGSMINMSRVAFSRHSLQFAGFGGYIRGGGAIFAD
eukprot:1113297-Prymnesium_polylepis.1